VPEARLKIGFRIIGRMHQPSLWDGAVWFV